MESLLAQFADKESRSSRGVDSTETPPQHDRDSTRNAQNEDADDGTPFLAVATPGSSSASAGPPATGLDAIDELSLKLNDLVVEVSGAELRFSSVIRKADTIEGAT